MKRVSFLRIRKEKKEPMHCCPSHTFSDLDQNSFYIKTKKASNPIKD